MTPLRPRANISEDVADALRRRILDGRLAPGARVNEVHLAADLGVSRTPLREALTTLVAEGALESLPRRGCFVRPLTVEELRGIYPIRALLDPEALRLAGLPDPAALAELERLNERLGKARRAEQRIELDDAWHLELIRACPNPELLELIRQFIRRTRRYELAYLREARHLQTAYDEHRKILRALARRDLPRACAALRRNLETGFEPIVKWLESRPAPEDAS